MLAATPSAVTLQACCGNYSEDANGDGIGGDRQQFVDFYKSTHYDIHDASMEYTVKIVYKFLLLIMHLQPIFLPILATLSAQRIPHMFPVSLLLVYINYVTIV